MVCRHRAPVPGHSWDTRGEVGMVDLGSWACTKAPGGSEELTHPAQPEARTLVDPTLLRALKYEKVSLDFYQSIQNTII